MDDIYGDLENYNDINALDELRKENQQLQFRLVEKTSDMEKLQKRYDQVSSDFKKMEINFSSLLKTAKAEIERKTQMIYNLNMEKDAMVLNNLKTTTKSLMHIRKNLLREKSHNVRRNKKDIDLDCNKPNRKADSRESKKFDSEKERKDEIRLPSEDTVTSGSTDHCTEKKHEKNSDTKENITKIKSRGQTIKNRRKSMPVLGKQPPIFSSDEENDDNSANESKKKDRYSRDDKSRRNYSDKVLHKIAETSGIDEKYSSYHESSRETYYRGKPSRQSDKHRNVRDKYEQSQKPLKSLRTRRHFSPEKPHRKAPRENTDEYYQRSDYGRHRVLESPPPDTLEVQRRSRRFNVDRGNQYEDKHRPHYEKHPVVMKHKLSDDTDEPSSKKAKTHSSSKSLEEEENTNKHQELVESSVPPRITDTLVPTSCLSPDYIDPEIVEPVKEIKSTAKANIEDPRLKSQKYVTQNVDDKAILCTVSSQNVELKPIDRSTWGTEQAKVPEALKHAPQFTENLVQQVYQDADKPISYTTPESGEIQSDNNEFIDVGTDTYFNEIYEQEKQRVEDLNLHNLYESSTIDFNTSKYDRFSDNNTSHKQTCNKEKQLDMPVTEYVIDKAKHDGKSDTRITIKLSKKESGGSNQQRKRESEYKKGKQHAGEEKVLSCREIVEGDLALSDETNDNILDPRTKGKCRTRSQHLDLENKSKSTSASKEKKIKSEDRAISSANQEEKLEEPLAKTIKTPKSKKKSHKTKVKSPKKTGEVTSKQTTEQQNKLMAAPKKTAAIKEKYTDLFGESSSLITPEDLGIISPTSTNKYVPIFEDAVDSYDINVKEIAETQKHFEQISDAPKPMEEDLKQKTKPKEKKKITKKDDGKRSSVDVEEEKEKGIVTPDCQAVTKEPDVVSTVIISTGVQPQVPPEEHIESIADRQPNFDLESGLVNVQPNDVLTPVEPMVAPQEKIKESQVNNEQGNEVLPHPESIVASQEKTTVVSERDDVHHSDVLTRLQQIQPAALATSTPYKELPVKNALIESDLRMAEASDSRTRNETATPSDLSSNMDTNSQAETDAPDLRIFVRRRKKVSKKTVS